MKFAVIVLVVIIKCIAVLVNVLEAVSNKDDPITVNNEQVVIVQHELEFIRNIKDYESHCNMITLKRIVIVFEAEQYDSFYNIAVLNNYITTCLVVFNKQIENYLEVMQQIGVITNNWLKEILSYINENGLEGALDKLKKHENPRRIYNLGRKISSNFKFHGSPSELQVQKESFYYGEAICFHANAPPMSDMKDFIILLLEKFGHLPEVKLTMRKQYVSNHNQHIEHDKKKKFAIFYFLQMLCEKLRNPPKTFNGFNIALYGEQNYRQDLRRRKLIHRFTNEKLPLKETSDCSMIEVYQFKWMWHMCDLVSTDAEKYEPSQKKLKDLAEEFLRVCIESWTRQNILPPLSLTSNQIPTEIKRAIDSWKTIARTHLDYSIDTYGYQKTYLDYLNPRLETERQENEDSLHNKFEKDVKKTKEILAAAVRQDAFYKGTGLCDYYLEQINVYQDTSSALYTAFEILEQLASLKGINIQSIDNQDEFTDHFNLFIICRTMRISPLVKTKKQTQELIISKSNFISQATLKRPRDSEAGPSKRGDKRLLKRF